MLLHKKSRTPLEILSLGKNQAKWHLPVKDFIFEKLEVVIQFFFQNAKREKDFFLTAISFSFADIN
jgi:hypothetical protein